MDRPIAEVDNVVVRYGTNTVLNGITAQFNPSAIAVILGTSGCGKTTLLKTIVGLNTPVSGTVRLFGEYLRDPDTPEAAALLKKVGVLFQNGALLGSLTVAQNVALPITMHSRLPSAVIDEMVQIKLTQVDLPHARDLYPGQLSGGMRKRAALARALALDPPILFCDEPSAGLDPVTSAGLDDLLLRLKELLGITVIVVTHELLSIETIADTVLFLHKGSVLFQGTYAEARSISQGPVFDFFQRKDQTETAAPGTEQSSFVYEGSGE